MSHFQRRKGHLLHLNDWIASSDEISAGKCRSSSNSTVFQNLFSSMSGFKALSDYFLFHKKKSGFASQRSGPIAVFCMSGPVTHVDDEEGKDSDLTAEKHNSSVPILSRSIDEADERSIDATIYSDVMKHLPRLQKLEKDFSNGDFYCGSCKDSLPHGYGKYLWADGCMYEGEWEWGKKTGRGKFFWPSGATYEGDFVGGCINGLGTYTGVDGTTYRGDWNVNIRHGLGRMRYCNGDVYEGSWKQGFQDGPGRYIWANDNVYMGDWRAGVMSGNGILKWCNGDVYDGEWMDGLQHGSGVFCWSDGSFYLGSWSKGLKDGKGVFVPPGSLPIKSLATSKTSSMTHQQRCNLIDQLIALGIIRKWSHTSAFDHDWFALKGLLRSRRGLSVEKIRSCHLGTGEQSRSRNARSNRKLAGKTSLEKIRLEAGNDSCLPSNATGESEEAFYLDHGTYPPPILEREYVQGVLITEIAKNPACTILHKYSKKRCRQEKEVKQRGEAIYEGHCSYDLMRNLQLGIRYSVGRMALEPRCKVGLSDFGTVAELRFPRIGSRATPCHHSVDFRWKDYCPKIFRHLREMFKIDPSDYMLSISGNDPLRELASPGKSGSAFFLSHDDRFLIKTLRKSEVKVLLGMLPSYYSHVQKYENTLITKFFGIHQVQPFSGRKVRFVVMGNMFCTDLHIHRRYDLKGSLQGRWTDINEIDESTTLKDLDLEYSFKLETSWREALFKQLECDCKLLESQGIMDYSMLLGVHFRAPQHVSAISTELLESMPPLQKQAGGHTGLESHKGLRLVPREPGTERNTPGLHIRGSPLRAPAGGNAEVDLLLPGTARLQIQLGVNMPARADQRFHGNESPKENNMLEEVHDVVLYLGIIDILQAYGVTKRIEHSYKSLQYDPLSISAVGPKVYAKRFQEFIRSVFPPTIT